MIGAGLSGDLLLAAADQVRRVAAAVHAAPPRRPVQPQPGELTNHSTASGHVAAVLTSDWLSGSVLQPRLQLQRGRAVPRGQRVPRRQLLRRARRAVPAQQPQAQQDRVQPGVRLLPGGQ